jgi:excisionase family DNA binding protein
VTQLLTTRELASRLRVSPTTVRHWTQAGLIPALKIKSNVYRFDLTAVMNALEKNCAELSKGGEVDED